ncbi:MAG: RNA polymerase-binding protein DksA [Rhodanobacteraceae bacterium]
MAKPKHGAAKRSGKQAKPAAKQAKARPAKKAAVKPARKPAGKAVHKPAKAAKAVKKPAKAAKSVKKAPARKAAPKSTIKNKSKIPVKKAASARKPKDAPAPHKSAPAKQTATIEHDAPRAAPQPARKQHAKPTGGVAARLSVGAVAAEQTITREDGRYALPATVNIDLPKGYHPSSKEEYMNPKQLAYFRQKLKDWRDQLVEESRQTMENLREEVRDVGDDAERATRETENSLELRTRDRYRKLISKIEKALRKIEEGRYGYCEETDEEIGLERLEARPIATLSLDAQERREHLQKQMGD